METARCRAFLAAAETGSFSRAAEMLRYTPSGVNQLVTALEKEIGFSLFSRSTKGVALTANGQLLLPVIREILHQEDKLFELSAQMNGLLIGTVTIAAYSSIATHWLPAVIRDFQENYPHVEIKLMEGIWQEVSQWLEERTADIGFLSYQENMPFEWIPLAEDPMLALLPQTLTLPGGGTASGWYIYALATDPGARSKGYGRQLLRFVDGYLAERGADCVTTVPAEPSLFKFFGTVGFAPCFSTRKLELLKSMLQPAAEGDRAEPVEPGEYNAIRRRLLEGAPAVDYPEELIRYQQGMGRLSGGGLYRLSVDGAEGCAAAEYTDGESVLFKELLLSPDKMGRGLAALERVLPGARCYVRTPALWDGMKGSYLQPFGMIKWYSAEKRALWGEGTHGYMGLGFD